MSRRIGVTMRVVEASGYSEPRDALAQDWSRFMATAFPEVIWLPVPNVGDAVAAYLAGWNIDGLILTGGNDVGENPLRDETERRAIHYALEYGFPVFGVCRGLQVIQDHFGGPLSLCGREDHVATVHTVRYVSEDRRFRGVTTRTVNSFHRHGVRISELATPLRAFAVSEDGLAEGIYHPALPVTAVQWHPERGPLDALDAALIRSALQI